MPKKAANRRERAPSSRMQSLTASSAMVVDMLPNLTLALRRLLASLGDSTPDAETLNNLRAVQVNTVCWLNYKKKDLILDAKTAFGKSTVLQSVSMLQRDSVTIVILPLDQIGKEQKEKVEALGSNPFFLHGPTSNATNRKHEVHLVPQWGLTFRKEYILLDLLRTWIGRSVPWFACTATLSAETLRLVKEHAGFADDVEIQRHSINREELVLSFGILPAHPGTKFEALRPFLEADMQTQKEKMNPEDIPKIIIFFNSKSEAAEAQYAIIMYLRKHPRFKFTRAHALASTRVYSKNTYELDKKEIIKEFSKPGTESPVRDIFATEALGLSVDLPDIRCVIQYKLPQDFELSVIWQRGGRACRDSAPGGIVFLADSWAVGKEKKKPNAPPEKQPNKDDDPGEVDEEQPARKMKPTAKQAAEKRYELPDIIYNIVNAETACVCELLLDHFEEPAKFRTRREERQCCCWTCQSEYNYGVMNLDNYGYCWIYAEQGNRPGKDAKKIQLLEKTYHLILVKGSVRKYFHMWHFVDEYGDELFKAIQAAVPTIRQRELEAQKAQEQQENAFSQHASKETSEAGVSGVVPAKRKALGERNA
ncbi:hypothetical protein KEM56_001082 [Ascosphaera pollenicola]|nr:hypothetical protein KEM56_001082 [Ascosphaera pollenicola]